MLADICRSTRSFVEASGAVKEALQILNDTADSWWEAEVYRLKGELTCEASRGSIARADDGIDGESSPGGPEQSELSADVEAERCFVKAIEIAQKQGAKSLELRATVSLARLWIQLHKKHDALDMLERIYRTFTEGFGDPDLKEAEALLGS